MKQADVTTDCQVWQHKDLGATDEVPKSEEEKKNIFTSQIHV